MTFIVLFLGLFIYQAVCANVVKRDTVVSGRTHSELNFQHPGIISTEEKSLEDCYRSCLEEKAIKCQFFKFINSTKRCYLSEKEEPDIEHLFQEHMHGHDNSAGNELKTPKATKSKIVINVPHIEEHTHKNPTVHKATEKENLVHHIHLHADRVEDKLHIYEEVRKKIHHLFSSLDKIRQKVNQLIMDFRTKKKSVFFLGKTMKKAFKQISKNRKSVKATANSQESLIKAIKAMIKKYKKLPVSQHMMASGELRRKLKQIKTFEKELKKNLDRMKKNAVKITANVAKIKSKLKHGYNNTFVKNLKKNQKLIIKSVIGMSKKTKSFQHNTSRLNRRIEKVWMAMKYGHKRRKKLVHNVKSIWKIVHALSKRPTLSASGNTELSRRLIRKYVFLKKLENRVMDRLKKMELRLKASKGNKARGPVFANQKLIFRKMRKILGDRIHVKKRMHLFHRRTKLLWKAIKSNDNELAKLNKKIGYWMGSKPMKSARVIRLLKRRYKLINRKFHRVIYRIRRLKTEHRKVKWLTRGYRRLKIEMRYLKHKKGFKFRKRKIPKRYRRRRKKYLRRLRRRRRRRRRRRKLKRSRRRRRRKYLKKLRRRKKKLLRSRRRRRRKKLKKLRLRRRKLKRSRRRRKLKRARRRRRRKNLKRFKRRWRKNLKRYRRRKRKNLKRYGGRRRKNLKKSRRRKKHLRKIRRRRRKNLKRSRRRRKKLKKSRRKRKNRRRSRRKRRRKNRKRSRRRRRKKLKRYRQGTKKSKRLINNTWIKRKDINKLKTIVKQGK